MKRAFLYIVLLTSLSVYGQEKGQDVFVKADFPAAVNSGQQFSVMWTVNSGGGEFTAPLFKGFNKLMGPQTSYSSSTQIINGKRTTETTYSYVYYLQAVDEGIYVIPPATFKLKNEIYMSDSMYIEVVGTSSSKQNPGSVSNNSTDNNGVESSGGDLFINLSLNKKEIYLGEHVVATVKLFTKVNLSGINEIKYPTFDGFLKSDIATPPLTSLKQENVNGSIYGTGVIQQFLLYPQVTGEIEIDPVQITVLIQQKSANSDPFFGDFFTSYQTIPKPLVSKNVNLKVKALPGIQPEDFSGVVGLLNLKAVMNKDTVNVNDAVNFRVTISGSGNLKVASEPKMKLSPDIEVYDPKVTDDIKNGTNGTSGQKSFEYLLIPRHYGDFTIPPITYSYFNTAKGEYEKLTTKEFHFYARKSDDQNTGITVYGGVSKEDVKYLGKDIRFIKSDPGSIKKAGSILLSSRAYFSIYGLSFLLFMIILFLRREHVRRNADLSLVRNRKAGKIAVKRLRNAAVCLKNQEIDKFYEEILKSIWGYISDKMDIPVSDLTRSSAINSLLNRGIDEDKLKRLTEILDTCEYARYAPSSSDTQAAEIYEGASQFIKSIENSVG